MAGVSSVALEALLAAPPPPQAVTARPKPSAARIHHVRAHGFQSLHATDAGALHVVGGGFVAGIGALPRDCWGSLSCPPGTGRPPSLRSEPGWAQPGPGWPFVRGRVQVPYHNVSCRQGPGWYIGGVLGGQAQAQRSRHEKDRSIFSSARRSELRPPKKPNLTPARGLMNQSDQHS